MKILITGSSGQLGQSIKKEIENSFTTISLSKSEFDITENNFSKINEIKPDVIVNAAAFTNVESAQNNYKGTMDSNYLGPKFLSEYAYKNSIKLIHFSTDYVFDGNKTEPYVESDKTNPLNVYGLSKLKGEKAISGKSIVIRTSWLYSIFPGNFLTNILKKMKNEEQISVVFDQIGTPTSCRSLAIVVRKIIEKIKFKKNIKNGIYHFSNLGQASWHDFAKKINDYANDRGLCNKIIVNRIMTKDLDLSAERPSFSVLNSEKITNLLRLTPKNWKHELKLNIESIEDF